MKQGIEDQLKYNAKLSNNHFNVFKNLVKGKSNT